jgi:hypothetical protein
MKTIQDLSASKLHPQEQELVRDAADGLLFCEDLRDDPAAEQGLTDLYELVDRLVDSDRMEPERGQRLIEDVEACGPVAPVG